MVTLSDTSVSLSSLIATMDMNASRSVRYTFGNWLQSKMDDRGWNKSEAAKALGVSPVTIGRWLKGRKPEAALVERVADVFVTDYDFLATMVGYRPRELMVGLDPLSDKARLMSKLQRVSLADVTRVRVLDSLLDGMLEDDVKAKREG